MARQLDYARKAAGASAVLLALILARLLSTNGTALGLIQHTHANEDALVVEGEDGGITHDTLSKSTDAYLYEGSSKIREVKKTIHSKCLADLDTMCWHRRRGLAAPCYSPLRTVHPAFTSMMKPHMKYVTQCEMKFKTDNASLLTMLDDINSHRTFVENEVLNIILSHFLEHLYCLSAFCVAPIWGHKGPQGATGSK